MAIVWLALVVVAWGYRAQPFRPYEPMLATEHSFRRNAEVSMESYGGLSFRFAAPEVRHRRKLTFTTDAAGCRNPRKMPPAQIVITGDSFVAGVGLDNYENIAAQLTMKLNLPVYNYGQPHTSSMPRFLADPRFAQRPPKVVFYMPSSSSMTPLDIPKRADEVSTEVDEPSFLEAIAAKIDGKKGQLDRDNGLRLSFRVGYHRLHRALFGFEQKITVEGTPALVTSVTKQRLDVSPDARELSEIVARLLWYRGALAARGTRLIVAPVPETGDVYLDHFHANEQARVHRPLFFDALLEALAASGIEAIDLRPLFAANRTPYLYLRDDTHWTPRSVELTAAHLAKHLTPR